MGKIFTGTEIQFRKVPNLSGFGKIVDSIKERFQDTDQIVGGVICGSILMGQHNVRSDLDCVVIYKTGATQAVIPILQGLTKEAERLHVPVEFIPVDTEGGRSGTHRLDKSFFEHLEWAIRKGGLVKENFLNVVKLPKKSLASDVRDYVRYKIERFEKDVISLPVLSESAECAVLKKFLESPVHVVRKIVRLRGDSELANGSTKNELVEYLKKIASDEIRNQLEAIVTTDAAYSIELKNQLKRWSPAEYGLMLNRIRVLSFVVLDFLRSSFSLIK